jgi:ABC-type dipeptide/oligopeptide/nickel transport system ATPase component
MLSTARLLKPSLIIADEPTSALDVLSGGQVVEEFSRLQTDLHAALILITHDLAVVQRLADRLIVMQRGRIVESGGAEVLVRPSHPYTQYLAGTRVALSNRFMRAAGRGGVR